VANKWGEGDSAPLRPVRRSTGQPQRVYDAQELPQSRSVGQRWTQALLKFVLSDRRVSCVIPATSSPQRMRDNARVSELPWFGDEEQRYVADLARR
jgi:aryl-alcohol dehydrogenase-like predicted oxidoreductase